MDEEAVFELSWSLLFNHIFMFQVNTLNYLGKKIKLG